MSTLNELFEKIRIDFQHKYGICDNEMSRFLFLFNPSHEMALAANDDNYTPTAIVRQMEHDLALLPTLFAKSGDCIAESGSKFIYDCLGNKLINYKENCIPFPWGWNRSVRNYFLKLGILKSNMPSDEELDWIRTFSCRSFHAKIISLFLKDRCILEMKKSFVGNYMEFCNSVDNCRNEMMPMIFKLPWSSSGRGNFVATEMNEKNVTRLKGFINNQGGFLKDVFYNKLLDFAMEFYIFSDGNVQFVGYSLFQADENGKYGGNLVESQDVIEKMITDKMSDENILRITKNVYLHLLKMAMAGKYTGFVGIDMMVVDTPDGRKCHPCVEINPRMNMGIVALAAYLRPFFFSVDGGGGSVVGDKRRSSTRTPSDEIRERGFHTCFKDRFISIRYS